MKIYKVSVLGWMEVIYTGIFANEELARKTYEEKVAKDIEKLCYYHYKTDIYLDELEEDKNGQFIYIQTLETY